MTVRLTAQTTDPQICVSNDLTTIVIRSRCAHAPTVHTAPPTRSTTSYFHVSAPEERRTELAERKRETKYIAGSTQSIRHARRFALRESVCASAAYEYDSIE